MANRMNFREIEKISYELTEIISLFSYAGSIRFSVGIYSIKVNKLFELNGNRLSWYWNTVNE